MPGTERSVRIAMADGVELAATLFLPDTGRPEPCLLEALPYRKDDLTSSYAASYRSLCEEVVAVRPRIATKVPTPRTVPSAVMVGDARPSSALEARRRFDRLDERHTPRRSR